MTRGGLDRRQRRPHKPFTRAFDSLPRNQLLTALVHLALALMMLLGIWRLVVLESTIRRALRILEGGCL